MFIAKTKKQDQRMGSIISVHNDVMIGLCGTMLQAPSYSITNNMPVLIRGIQSSQSLLGSQNSAELFGCSIFFFNF